MAEAAWDETVSIVRVVVHNTGRKDNTPASGNHTTTYFIVGDGTSSIQLNMRTEPEYIDGVMTMEPRDYAQSRSSLKQFDLLPAGRFTPREVFQWVTRLGFQDYTFTGGGIGCSLLVVYLLERSQHLPKGTTLALHVHLPFLYSTRRDPVPLPLQQGTFDRRQTQANAVRLWTEIMSQAREKAQALARAGRTEAPAAAAAASQLRALRDTATQGAALALQREQEEEEGEDEDEEDDNSEDEG